MIDVRPLCDAPRAVKRITGCLVLAAPLAAVAAWGGADRSREPTPSALRQARRMRLSFYMLGFAFIVPRGRGVRAVARVGRRVIHRRQLAVKMWVWRPGRAGTSCHTGDALGRSASRYLAFIFAGKFCDVGDHLLELDVRPRNQRDRLASHWTNGGASRRIPRGCAAQPPGGGGDCGIFGRSVGLTEVGTIGWAAGMPAAHRTSNSR